MWIFLELIVIAIVVLNIIFSAKRGFVRTAIELVGFGLSIYLAFIVGGLVANGVYDTMIEPAIVNSVVEQAGDTATENVNETVTVVFENIPKSVKLTAENLLGITEKSIKESIDSATLNLNGDTREMVLKITDSVARPIIVPLIKTLVAFIVFIVLLFVVKFLARFVNRAFSLPIIGGLNRTLGAVLGFAKGLIVAAVVCILLSTIVAMTTNGFLFFTVENVAKTTLFKLLAGFSPLS